MSDVHELDSFDVVVASVQEFQNKDIEAQYRQTTEDSLLFDPEAQFSIPESSTVQLDFTADSELRDSLLEDAEALTDNPNGAILHTHNVGRGIRTQVNETFDEIRQNTSYSEIALEILESRDSETTFNSEWGGNAVYHLSESIDSFDQDASTPMALGMLTAYHEHDP